MLNLYSAKRREPRVRLRIRVRIAGVDTLGNVFEEEALTLDVSPRGASVLLDRRVEVGSTVSFQALRYTYETSSVVRSIFTDRATGSTAVGLEFLSEAPNPLVIWSAAPTHTD